MSLLSALLKNRDFVFFLGLFTALAAPYAVPYTKPLALPALALVLALSTTTVSNSAFLYPRKILLPALAGVFMNYLVLGSFIIILAAIFIREEVLWKGFVLMAAVPAAIGVIPFSIILKGNVRFSLFGTIGAYLGAMLLLPLIVIGLLGAGTIKPTDMLLIMLQLVVLPLIASRLLIRQGWDQKIEPFKGIITNWSFFLVLYSSIAINRDVLMTFSPALFPVILISFASTFLIGFLVKATCRLFKVSDDIATSLTLLGSMKNYGVASGIALTFLPKESVLPAAITTIFMILFVMCLDWGKRRKRQPRN